MATAREHSVFLMEALWTRFMPTVNKALALIENRAIGDLVLIRADFGVQRRPGLPQTNRHRGPDPRVHRNLEHPWPLARRFLAEPVARRQGDRDVPLRVSGRRLLPGSSPRHGMPGPATDRKPSPAPGFQPAAEPRARFRPQPSRHPLSGHRATSSIP